jgi:biofilm PGA synthesis N-glycosyltransferase PgaC
LASAVYRMAHPPYVTGGLAMFWGYLNSLIKGLPRFEDEELVKFVRKYQWACLLKGKSRATDELNAKQAEVWRG